MSNDDTDEEETPCIVEKIRDYRKDKINPIILNKKNTDEVKEKLVEELQRVRFHYNLWNSFSSNFVLSFLSGLIGLLVGQVKNISADGQVNSIDAISVFIGVFFLIILLCQFLFVCKTNTYYEKMKVVEDELEKINSAVQPNSKK